MSKRIDLTGKTFHNLKVLKYNHTEKPRGESFYDCQCDCGNTTVVSAGHLKTGHTRSCGCLQIKIAIENSMGNTWGRKYTNPMIISAHFVWECSYNDGCTFEAFMRLSQLDCYYCGIPADQSNCFNKYINKDNDLTNVNVSTDWARRAYFKYNGLDKIDPKGDHKEENIVPSCFQCNRAKDDWSVTEFAEWIARVNKHFLKK
jgi:hypothetical protein